MSQIATLRKQIAAFFHKVRIWLINEKTMANLTIMFIYNDYLCVINVKLACFVVFFLELMLIVVVEIRNSMRNRTKYEIVS